MDLEQLELCTSQDFDGPLDQIFVPDSAKFDGLQQQIPFKCIYYEKRFFYLSCVLSNFPFLFKNY